MKTTKIPATVLALACALSAQSPADDARLVRARTLHEVEHDTQSAAKLYRTVAEDGEASASTRAQAWLELAEAERRMGRTEAAREALAKAASGQGRAAEEAARRMQDPQATLSDIELQILELIRSCRGGAATSTEQSLLFYGDRALPLIFRSIESEGSDLAFVGALARVVWRGGGEMARAWLTEEAPKLDALRRRAVVSATRDFVQIDVRDAVAVFVNDPDPGVRLETCRPGRDGIPYAAEAIVGLLRDPDPRVVERAVGVLSDARIWRWNEPEITAAAGRALMASARELGEPTEGMRRVGAVLAGERAMLAYPAGRKLALEAVTLLGARSLASFDEGRSFAMANDAFVPPQANELLDELLQASEFFGDDPFTREDLLELPFRVDELRQGMQTAWDRDAVPGVLTLARRGLGYGAGTLWLERYATREDWQFVLRDPAGYPVELVHAAALELAKEGIPADCVEGLRTWVDGVLDGRVVAAIRRAIPAEGPKWLYDTAYEVAAAPGDAAVEWVEATLRSETLGFPIGDDHSQAQRFRWELLAGLTRQGTPARVAAVRRIVLDADLADDSLRNHALGWLLHQGAEKPVELILAANELGLAGLAAGADRGVVGRRMPEMRANVRNHPIGVEWLFVEGLPGYDAAQLDAVVRARLRAGDERAWIADLQKGAAAWSPARRARIMELVAFCPSEKGVERFTEFLYEALTVDDARYQQIEVPEGELLATFVGALTAKRPFSLVSEVRNLVRAIEVRGPVPAELQETLVEMLRSDDRRVREMAIELFAEDRVRLRALYEDESYPSRSAVLEQLFWRESPERRADLLVGALSDPAQRSAALSLATSVLDERLVEPLLACLRDSNSAIREKAQSALDSQRAWLEEEARWVRLRSATDLDSTSAAQALLNQADAAQPKPIRLAAIRSLGTLALPETLPLLIEMLRDQDPEITAAATASIERINRRDDD